MKTQPAVGTRREISQSGFLTHSQRALRSRYLQPGISISRGVPADVYRDPFLLQELRIPNFIQEEDPIARSENGANHGN